MELDAALRESIVMVCAVSPDAVTPDASLEALGVDSLAAAEIITDLEIRLGTDLPMDVLRRLGRVRTVADVADELRSALAGQGATPGS